MDDRLHALKNHIAAKRLQLTVLAFVLSVFLAPVALLLWMTAVPGSSYAGPLSPLTMREEQLARQLRQDVRMIASKPHNLEHRDALNQAAAYIETRLASFDYSVRRDAFAVPGQMVWNLESVIEPVTPAARTLVIGAHYDSFGEAPGANDNASGSAAVLQLARLLRDLQGKSQLRIRLVLFANEEPPFFKTNLMGSRVYARRLKATDEEVLGMISLETIGYYDDRPGSQRYPPPLDLFFPSTGNFIAFVGEPASRGWVRQTIGAFRRQARFPSEGGTAPAFVSGIDWSDHWAFQREGFPAVMVTDTAPFRYPFYHSAGDLPERLDYQRMARIVAGLEKIVRSWATSRDVR